MFRHDFIMRMIKRFINAVTLVLRLRREQQYHHAHEVIEQTLEELFGLPADTIRAVAERTLLGILQVDATGHIEPCLMAARLFMEDGRLAEAEGNEAERYARYLKALDLYLAVAATTAASSETFLLMGEDDEGHEIVVIDPQADIETLVQKLETYMLPVATRRHLFRYYEKFGRFARAEDVLFDLLDHDKADPATIEMGERFYRRLLDRGDEELHAGDLPREEVVEGLERLRRMR